MTKRRWQWVCITVVAGPYLWPGMYSGYYFWLASMAFLAVSGGCLALATKREWAQIRPADQAPQLLPDPSVFALFNQPRTDQKNRSKVHSGAPPGEKASRLQPPCSPSSST
jgi:hypothetical protein